MPGLDSHRPFLCIPPRFGRGDSRAEEQNGGHSSLSVCDLSFKLDIMVTSLVGKNIERPSVFCYGVSAEKVFGLQMVNTVSYAFLQVYHLLLLFKHVLKYGVYLPVCARRGFLLFPQMTIQAFHPFDERPIFFLYFPSLLF